MRADCEKSTDRAQHAPPPHPNLVGSAEGEVGEVVVCVTAGNAALHLVGARARVVKERKANRHQDDGNHQKQVGDGQDDLGGRDHPAVEEADNHQHNIHKNEDQT